jgi:LAS superfamily LD-carboxypeptidase LdcB
MRVISKRKHHSDNGEKKVYRKNSRLKVFGVFLIIVIPISAFLYINENKTKNINNSEKQNSNETVVVEQPDIKVENKDGKEYKEFNGDEFRQLYLSVAYPNTQQIQKPISITGNDEADSRIRKLAEERGYKQTSIPQGAIVKVDEPRLEGDNLLQPLALQGWKSLKSAAEADNIPVSLISAYRSPEWQRDLFLSRLLVNGITPAQIAAGIQDKAISNALSSAAVPGYSRHHTGYTIDLWCEDGSSAFLSSICFKWIKANNYLKAKESGWIPSYPEGADEQGPEPEPWEYVWVGEGYLK